MFGRGPGVHTAVRCASVGSASIVSAARTSSASTACSSACSAATCAAVLVGADERELVVSTPAAPPATPRPLPRRPTRTRRAELAVAFPDQPVPGTGTSSRTRRGVTRPHPRAGQLPSTGCTLAGRARGRPAACLPGRRETAPGRGRGHRSRSGPAREPPRIAAELGPENPRSAPPHAVAGVRVPRAQLPQDRDSVGVAFGEPGERQVGATPAGQRRPPRDGVGAARSGEDDLVGNPASPPGASRRLGRAGSRRLRQRASRTVSAVPRVPLFTRFDGIDDGDAVGGPRSWPDLRLGVAVATCRA